MRNFRAGGAQHHSLSEISEYRVAWCHDDEVQKRTKRPPKHSKSCRLSISPSREAFDHLGERPTAMSLPESETLSSRFSGTVVDFYDLVQDMRNSHFAKGLLSRGQTPFNLGYGLHSLTRSFPPLFNI